MGVFSPRDNIVSRGGVDCEFLQAVFHLRFIVIDGL